MAHHTPNGRGLGWRPQLPDHRDLMYSAPITGNLPTMVDLRPQMPPVYDQGQLGSCTANAIAGALQYDRMRQGLPDADRVPSRLMIYFEERQLEGTVQSDAGAEIRDGIKMVAQNGTCFEDGPDGWPYDPSKFTDAPPQQCYQAALKDRALRYRAVPQIAQQIRGALAAKDPVVFGFSCFSALDGETVATGGRLPLPAPAERTLGGHAVMIAGYDDGDRNFLVRNSWAANWGLRGYFLMPYEYVLRGDLASNFWVIDTVG
jgi:C1A family cysteine protease